MSNKPESILIVDDYDDLRTSLVYLFTSCGFRVREASDGFGALAAIKLEMPDILISDLNMPGMCGFELLSIVRRRFPAIGVIAMSAAYSGDCVPPGAAADAFYAKGGESVGSLFGMVNALIERDGAHQNRSTTPVWIHQFAIDNHPESAHLMWCPECLRTFSQCAEIGSAGLNRARCPHCSSELQFGMMAFPGGQSLPQPEWIAG